MHNLEVIFFRYDAWGATPTIKQLELNTGWPLEPIRQCTSELKSPTKFLQKIFVEETVTRLDDKIMEKVLLNAEYSKIKLAFKLIRLKPL